MAIRVTAALLVAFLYFTITVAAPVNDEGLIPPAINGELYAVPDTEVEPMQANCVNPFNLNIPAFIFNVIIRTCQVTNSVCGRVYVEAGSVARVDVGVCRQGPSEPLSTHKLRTLLTQHYSTVLY